MTPYTTSTAELLFVEVPEGAKGFHISVSLGQTFLCSDGGYVGGSIPIATIAPGPWQLLGLGSDITDNREIPKEYLTSAYAVLKKQ